VPRCRLPLLCCLITDITTNMSTTEDSHGEVDGHPISWRYQRTGNDQEGSFSWAEQDGNMACKYYGVVSSGRLHLTRSSDWADNHHVGLYNRRPPVEITPSGRIQCPLRCREQH
jgi:hypothetical protein